MKSILYKSIVIPAIFLFTFLSAIAQDSKITTNSSCRLFSDIDNVSSVILYIPKGTELAVIEYSGEYALVEYEETLGWIRLNKTNAAEIAAVQDNLSREANDRFEQQISNSNDRFSILVEKYGYRTGKAIFEHKIWKGIDNNMVRDSWGKPLQVSREVNNNETSEIWTYRRSWLLIQNGILIEWGPNR